MGENPSRIIRRQKIVISVEGKDTVAKTSENLEDRLRQMILKTKSDFVKPGWRTGTSCGRSPVKPAKTFMGNHRILAKQAPLYAGQSESIKKSRNPRETEIIFRRTIQSFGRNHGILVTEPPGSANTDCSFKTRHVVLTRNMQKSASSVQVLVKPNPNCVRIHSSVGRPAKVSIPSPNSTTKRPRSLKIGSNSRLVPNKAPKSSQSLKKAGINLTERRNPSRRQELINLP